MLNFYGKTFSSRLLIGTALYPSPKIMQDAIRASGADIVTVSLRRESAGGKAGDAFWSLIRELGVTDRAALKLLRQRLPDITLIVDAGLGAPSHAAEALELGYDGVLLNTAIAKAADPVAMAGAFRLGVEAGRTAYETGLMQAPD